MIATWNSAAFTGWSLAALLAVLAPNFSGGGGSFVVASLLAPALIALPPAIRAFRRPAAVSLAMGALLALSGLLVHAGISFMMLPYGLATYAEKMQGQLEYQMIVITLVFLACGVISFLSRRRRARTL